MQRRPLEILALVAALSGIACTAAEGPTGRVAISVAPLDLAGVGNASYTVEVRSVGGELVWSRGIDSASYGAGDGSAAYVGPCDADPDANPNRVSLTVTTLYASDGTTPLSAGAWQDPGTQTKTVICLPNEAAGVDFDLTLLRPATQGFFDVAVAFSDVFCSAKLDCCAAPVGGACPLDGTGDLLLLHDAEGDRGRTFVLGFACTAGPNDGVETALAMDDLVLDCGALAPAVTVDPGVAAAGNQCTPGDDGMSTCAVVHQHGGADADDFLFQVAVFRGTEALTSGGIAARKVYWNVALGVKPDIATCTLRTRATAWDANGDDGVANGVIAAGSVYPYVAWDVDLSACAKEALSFGASDDPVAATYTDVGASQPTTLQNVYAPSAPVAPTAPGTPGGLSAAPGDGEVALTWSAPASDGGATVTSYLVTILGGAGGTVDTGSGATSVTITGLDNGTSYRFTVAATNNVGTGPPSEPSEPVVPFALPGSAPTLSGASLTGISWEGGQRIALVGTGFDVHTLRPVTITNGATALTDYQAVVTIDGFTPVEQGKARADWADLRVLDGDKTTPLDFWVDPETVGTYQMKVWVRLPTLGAGEARLIHLAYGDPTATSASSGPDTFDRYDDFDDDVTDPALWEAFVTGGVNGVVSETGGELKLTGVASTAGYHGFGYSSTASLPLYPEWNVISARFRLPVGAGGSNRAHLFVWGGVYVFGVDIYPAGTVSPGYHLDYFNGSTWIQTGLVGLFGDEASTFHTISVAYNRTTHVLRAYVDGTQIGSDVVLDLGSQIDFLQLNQQYVTANGQAVDTRFDDFRVRHHPATLPTVAVGAEQLSLPTVTLGGATAEVFAVPAATKLLLTTPPGAIGPTDVVVTNPNGQSATLSGLVAYTGQAPPTLAASPLSPATGAVAGGTSVTVNGAGFYRGWKRTLTLAYAGATTLVDSQVSFTMNTSGLISAGHLRSDGGDLRFFAQDGTPIPYWVESGMNTTSTRVWIKVPQIPSGGTTVTVRYGVPGRQGASDGPATFDDFDDFDDDYLDTDTGHWQVMRGGAETAVYTRETGGELVVSGTVTASDFSARGLSAATRPVPAGITEVSIDFRRPVSAGGGNRCYLFLNGPNNQGYWIDAYPPGTVAAGYNYEYFDGAYHASSTLGLFGNEATTFHRLRLVYNRDTHLLQSYVDGTKISSDLTSINPGTSLYWRFAQQSVTPTAGVETRFDAFRVRHYGTSAVTPSLGSEVGEPPAVTFDGTPSPSVTVVSSTELTVVTPAGAAGMATVVVTNTDGQAAAAPSAWTWQ